LISARYESQSAFGKFVETLKEQIKKNKELQDSVKKLQDESGKVGESDALKKAKDAFGKAKVKKKSKNKMTLWRRTLEGSGIKLGKVIGFPKD